MTKTLKTSLIAIMAVAVMGAAIVPLAASAQTSNKNQFVGFWNQMVNMFKRTAYDDQGIHTGQLGISRYKNVDTSLSSALTTYNQALNQANKTYDSAKNSDYKTYISAWKAAVSNDASEIAALKVYLAAIQTAYNQMVSAKQTAFQTLINAVNSVNVTTTTQAPTANIQSITVNENSSIAVTLTGSDPQNLSLTYALLGNPAHGTLSGTIPNLTYTPSTNYVGSDSFTFKVNDGSLDSPVATVSITVNP